MIFQLAAVAFWLFASSGHIISLSNSQIWKFMVQGFSLIESIWPIGLHRLRLKATICHSSTSLNRSRGAPFRPWPWRIPRCCARCPGSSCVASCASRWARSRLRRWRLPSVGCRWPLGVGRGWSMADIFSMFAVFEILCKSFFFRGEFLSNLWSLHQEFGWFVGDFRRINGAGTWAWLVVVKGGGCGTCGNEAGQYYSPR